MEVIFIDIEDYYGNPQNRIELPFAIEIISKKSNVPFFSYADIQLEDDGNVLRIQFDGEENGYYDIDEVEESISYMCDYIDDLLGGDCLEDYLLQQIRESIENIMRP